MNDPIIEEVWRAKEAVAEKAPGDMRALAARIKETAAKLRESARKSSQK
jgi:hypothetical protein